MNEYQAASHYGQGGRNCVCCGPSPSWRKKHDRMVKRRVRQQTVREIKKMLEDLKK